MNVPEILHDFIAGSYNPEELKAMLSDSRNFPDAANTTVFVDDFLRRPALWGALSALNDSPDMSRFTPEIRLTLANWVAEIAPDAIQRYRQSLVTSTGNRHVDAENKRVIDKIRNYFPEAYQVLFG